MKFYVKFLSIWITFCIFSNPVGCYDISRNVLRRESLEILILQTLAHMPLGFLIFLYFWYYIFYLFLAFTYNANAQTFVGQNEWWDKKSVTSVTVSLLPKFVCTSSWISIPFCHTISMSHVYINLVLSRNLVKLLIDHLPFQKAIIDFQKFVNMFRTMCTNLFSYLLGFEYSIDVKWKNVFVIIINSNIIKLLIKHFIALWWLVSIL